MRRRLAATYAYAGSGCVLMGVSAAVSFLAGGAALLAEHSGMVVGVGLLAPLLCMVLTRHIGAHRPVCKHLAWLGLNVTLGLVLSYAGAWGIAVWAPTLFGVGALSVALAALAQRGRQVKTADISAFEGPVTAAMLGLAVGPALLPQLAPGLATLVGQMCVGVINFLLISVFLATDMRRIAEDAAQAPHFDPLGRSVALYVQVITLFFGLGKTLVASRKLRHACSS